MVRQKLKLSLSHPFLVQSFLPSLAAGIHDMSFAAPDKRPHTGKPYMSSKANTELALHAK